RVVFPHADREGPPGRGGYVQGSDEAFDPTGFLLPAERVASLDRSVQWLLHAGRSALHEGGLERGDGSERMGVVAGSLLLPTVGLSRFAESVWFEGPGALAEHVRARLERPDPRDRFMSGLPVRDVA